jgi:hypothetical protein
MTANKSMVVDILESNSDRLMNDVASRLNGIAVEFMSVSGERFPMGQTYRVVVDRLSFRYPF